MTIEILGALSDAGGRDDEEEDERDGWDGELNALCLVRKKSSAHLVRLYRGRQVGSVVVGSSPR
jgi:hypothetical protein